MKLDLERVADIAQVLSLALAISIVFFDFAFQTSFLDEVLTAVAVVAMALFAAWLYLLRRRKRQSHERSRSRGMRDSHA